MIEGADKKLEVAREAGARLAREPGVLGVYLAGSLSAGLGTPTSDVDLYVVADDATDEDVVPPQERVGSERLDVEYRSPAAIAAMPQPFQTFVATSDDLSSLSLTPRQIDDAMRLLLGEDVVSCDVVTQARRTMRTSESALRQVLISRYALDCKCVGEDLAGALATEDIDAALYLSAALVMRAVQAYLVGCGELYPGEKWTWQKLRQAQVDERVVTLLRRALASSPVPDADVRRRARFAQSLLVAALVDGWKGGAAVSTLVSASTTPGHVREPLAFPIRTVDGVVMFNFAGSGEGMLLSVPGLTLWGLCDGRASLKIVADAAKRLSLEPDALGSYLDSLVEHGLVAESR